MNKENSDKIKNDFPRLFPEKFGFECGDGWFDLLYKLARRVDRQVDKLPSDEHDGVMFFQIKEKFGSLRIYWRITIANSDIVENIRALVNYAEYKSTKLCDKCGKEGISRNDIGWVRTLCEEHHQEIKNKRV